MCGKGWVVKGYSAFSEDSTVLKGYAERGVVVLLQWLWEWKGSVQREGQARQGCLKRVCAKFCTDAKPYKHTQALALRKAREIVRFWKGWWSDNPSGSRTNFFGRQHLTFDKGRAWMPEVERPEFRKDAKPTERATGLARGAQQRIVRFWRVMRREGLLSFCKGCRNTESEGDSTGLGGYAGRGSV